MNCKLKLPWNIKKEDYMKFVNINKFIQIGEYKENELSVPCETILNFKPILPRSPFPLLSINDEKNIKKLIDLNSDNYKFKLQDDTFVILSISSINNKFIV